MKKIKVGDKFLDLGYARNGWDGYCTVVRIINEEGYKVVFPESQGVTAYRDIYDDEMIPEEIYNSPLWQVMQEK